MSGLTLGTFTSAYLFLPVPLTGTDSEGASTLQYSLDGGPWQLVWDFSAGSTWSGQGPRLPLTAVPGVSHTVQVQNPANGNKSNVVTFTTAGFIPPTYIISGDGPTQGTLGATSGNGGSVLAIPPGAPVGELNPALVPVAGTLAVANWTTGPGYGIFMHMFYGAGDTNGSLQYASGQNVNPLDQQLVVDYYQSGSGTGSLVIPISTSATFTTEQYPWYVLSDGSLLKSIAATSVNGTLIYAGQLGNTNTGVLFPLYYDGSSGPGPGYLSASPQVTASTFNLSLGAVAPVGASTTITLTGTDSEPILATGMDYNVDFASSGSGSLTSLVYERVSTFSGASTQGGTWTATIPGLSAGTHLITVRNHDVPMLESNTDTVTVLGPANLRVSQVVKQAMLQQQRATLRVSQVVKQVMLQAIPNARVGLYQTDVLPSPTDTYVEFGAPMSWQYETALLPDNQQQRNNAMIVTTLDMAFIGNVPTVNTQFLDSAGNVLQAAAVAPAGVVPRWDIAKWDLAEWDGAPSPLSPWQLAWPAPIAFKQGYLLVSGLSQPGFKIGAAYLEYQILGYVQQYPSGRQ
jgi:hypothetical protein